MRNLEILKKMNYSTNSLKYTIDEAPKYEKIELIDIGEGVIEEGAV